MLETRRGCMGSEGVDGSLLNAGTLSNIDVIAAQKPRDNRSTDTTMDTQSLLQMVFGIRGHELILVKGSAAQHHGVAIRGTIEPRYIRTESPDAARQSHLCPGHTFICIVVGLLISISTEPISPATQRASCCRMPSAAACCCCCLSPKAE